MTAARPETTATRHLGAQASEAAITGTNHWLALFATARRRAIDDAETFEDRVAALRSEWKERLGPVRANSAAGRLLHALPGAPIVTVRGAAELIGRSYQAKNGAVERLVGSQVLRQVSVGRRNRAFEAPELIDTFTELERRLASPTGNARAAPPSRRTPQHPPRRGGPLSPLSPLHERSRGWRARSATPRLGHSRRKTTS